LRSKPELIILVCLILVFSSGCDLFKKKRPNPYAQTEQSLPQVKDMDIAYDLIKPHVYNVTVARDPFKPVIEQKNSFQVKGEKNSEFLTDLKLLGIVTLGSEKRALLRTGAKTGTYSSGENIFGYTLETIEADRVVLVKEDKKIELILEKGER